MKNIYKINSPLFKGMDEEETASLLNCLGASKKTYTKGSFIWNAGDDADYIGLVVDGQVNVIKEDFFGNRLVIANIMSPQIFGESFSIAHIDTYPVSAQAATDCTIILLQYKKLTTVCSNTCSFHQKLVDNLLTLLARKNIKLRRRIDCLTKKNTQAKLAYYLMTEMKIEKNNEVIIPFNREELADYLGVNRSALSRELSKLKKENIISFNKNKFELLDLDKLQNIVMDD